MIQKIQDAVASTVTNYDKLPQSRNTAAADQKSDVQQPLSTDDTGAPEVSNAAPAVAAGETDSEDDKTKQADQEKQAEHITKEDAGNITEALNELMSKMNCDLEFKYYDKLDQLTVKMIDKKTKETIKEFPPEEVIKAMIKTKDWIGTFLDKLA